ncbi:hypothetical protein RYH73_03380 [Olivibacter sp. CPCC 100613]|uniref:hypothetical protein n=1 Tax=Olivibacter sp. CPCC 100613 TaxID=3079931 RepID=UPI002FF83237
MKAIDKPNISFRFTASNERVKGMIDAVLVVRYKRKYVPVNLPIRIYMRYLAKNKTNTYRMYCDSYNLYAAYKEKLNDIAAILNDYNVEYDAVFLRDEINRIDQDWNSSKLKKYVTRFGQLIN